MMYSINKETNLSLVLNLIFLIESYTRERVSQYLSLFMRKIRDTDFTSSSIFDIMIFSILNLFICSILTVIMRLVNTNTNIFLLTT